MAIIFKAYDPSAYHVIIQGLKPTGLFVRQPKVLLGSELGINYLLSFPEIGIEESFSNSNEVYAVDAAKKIVQDRFTMIFNNLNSTQ